MVIGFGETPAQRVQSLLRLREAQDRALAEHGNGFSAFISWTLQTKGVRIEGARPAPARSSTSRTSPPRA
jgi:cyclic dehypoxanthinyl futalosine synthase